MNSYRVILYATKMAAGIVLLLAITLGWAGYWFWFVV